MLGRLLDKVKKTIGEAAPDGVASEERNEQSPTAAKPASEIATASTTGANGNTPPSKAAAPFTPIRSQRWRPDDTVLEHYRVLAELPAITTKSPQHSPERSTLNDGGDGLVTNGNGGRRYHCRHLVRPFEAVLETPPPGLLGNPAGLRRIIARAEQRVRLGMHPNLTTAYNLRFSQRLPVLIGEWPEGQNLEQWLATRGNGSLRVDLSLAIQCCHGLEHCHDLGVIHGRISPRAIIINPNSLLKVDGLGLAPPPAGSDAAADILAFGRCLWKIFCAAPPYSDNDQQRPGKPRPRQPDLEFPLPLQVALFKCVAADPARRYRKFSELRRDLNAAYRELFKISCPYYQPPKLDFRAEILNNQAVMLFEEGKTGEALRKLSRSLELNDTLPAAVYNDLLYRWRLDGNPPARILRRLQAGMLPGNEKLGPDPNLPRRPDNGTGPPFLELERAVKLNISALKDELDQRDAPPPWQMVAPPGRLQIYRRGEERRRLEGKLHDHLQAKRWQACHDLLHQVWRRQGFAKDKFFNAIYEELLQVREKERPVAGQRFLRLSGHQGPVNALACVPRSRRIASLGVDGRIIIHDLGAGSRPKIAESRELPATALAACPTGKHLAVGSSDGGVHLLSSRSAKVLGQEQSHRSRVCALAFSHDGKLLASAAEDGSIIIRRLATGREDAVSLADSGPINALLFPDESLELISGSDDGRWRRWKSRLRDCLLAVEAHPGALYALAAAPELLISAGADRRIKIWEQATGREQRNLKGHGERIRALLTMADQRTLLSAGDDELIMAWELAAGKKIFSLDGRGGGIRCLAPGLRPHIFLAGRADGNIDVWLLIYQLKFDIL